MEVAPSNPNIVYAGTGDKVNGGGVNVGNGIYKSEDAGATWKHLGLDDSRVIPSILVDPKGSRTSHGSSPRKEISPRKAR